MSSQALTTLPSENSQKARSSTSGDESPLRREIAELGNFLGCVIAEVAGLEQLQLVETIRRLSRDFRQGLSDGVENDRLQNLLASLDCDQLRIVIRAFTVFLDLANMAEDRERVRVLKSRLSDRHSKPAKESIQAAISELKALGKSPREMQQLIDSLHLELVFTAHPTEAKRRSIRNKLRAVRDLLEQRDLNSSSPTAIQKINKAIYAELTKLWLTDFIRPWRPTVLQEVQRGLAFKPNLWEVTPRIADEIRRSLAREFSGESFHVNPCIHFGSWIGGDRDGHPYVTPEVTEQTLIWLRNAAVDFHLQTCRLLRDSLSISKRQISMSGGIEDRIAESRAEWPELDGRLQEVPPGEILRQWLVVIQWRLSQTRIDCLESLPRSGAYPSTSGLLFDVHLLHSTLLSFDAGKYVADETATWLDRINTFGLHLARLDIRQDARTYRLVIDELCERAGLVGKDETLGEPERQALLAKTLALRIEIPADNLSDAATETLTLFRLLRQAVDRFGYEALGSHVVSMTSQPSDILSVMWLWKHADTVTDGKQADSQPIPIVPLFETIDDLHHARGILADLLNIASYRDLLRSQDDRQTVMLGYSDSTKDGGYLTATHALYESQQELQQLATESGIDLVFFHGRGGSLGRGGGPAARSILSLPRKAFHGALRLTEQGEVLADRYDDPNIAYRHLEQLVWSSLLASGTPQRDTPRAWSEMMRRLSKCAFTAYRGLVGQPGFVEFFRGVTPISEVEQLPIGSRPSRRRGGNSLSDLRAIPWVFSWTQSRFLLPAWYGIGSALAQELEDPVASEQLRNMYLEWPFFRATIDNAELALAKTDLGVASSYIRLLQTKESGIARRINEEFERSKRSILRITGDGELLDGTPWLKESISVRNWYIDPLNFIQVELLRRLQAQSRSDETSTDHDELHHLARLTINGLAAGMRTTG